MKTLHLLACLGAVVVAVAVAAPALCDQAKLPDLKDRPEMNGIRLSKYDHFWNDWKLVTVRFRTDQNEQRFIYANAPAWKALLRGGHDYPDGAVFGKVAFRTAADPAFPVSEEPDQYTRIQLMVRDKKKYAETEGWGYALALAKGAGGDAKAPESDHATAKSCHACHTLARDRGFVFSSTAFTRPAQAPLESLQTRFKSTATGELGPFEQRIIAMLGPTPTTKAAPALIEYYKMDLFLGSLYEAAPVLASFAGTDHKAYLLSDTVNVQFAAAEEQAGSCTTNAKLLLISNVGTREKPRLRVHAGTSCDGKVSWQKVSFL